MPVAQILKLHWSSYEVLVPTVAGADGSFPLLLMPLRSFTASFLNARKMMTAWFLSVQNGP